MDDFAFRVFTATTTSECGLLRTNGVTHACDMNGHLSLRSDTASRLAQFRPDGEMRFVDAILESDETKPIRGMREGKSLDAAARFNEIIAAIDAVNATDPNLVEVDGQKVAAELIYGQRISQTLARLYPNPSECLRIAARGQHIERWKVSRKIYPSGRDGYLAWRKYQRAYQAMRLGGLMADVGYEDDDIRRVGSLIRKERLKSDREAHMLEDAICTMFFEHYLSGFMVRVEDEKLAGILAKTWSRMSEHGHREVLRLVLPARVPELLERGLRALRTSS